MTKAEIENELIEAREMLRASKKRNQSCKLGLVKYKGRYGSYPADNFEALDIHTDVNVYQSYVDQLINQLKAIS